MPRWRGITAIACSTPTRDSGRDYLTHEYNAHWLRENGFAEIADRFAE